MKKIKRTKTAALKNKICKRFVLLAATLFTTLLLSSCAATKAPKQSEGHLAVPARTQGDIPKAVAKTPFLPPPKSAPKQETYTVVVNDVSVKELLFALARDAKLNVDIHPKVKGKATLNAINQTLPQILNRISEQVDLRFKIDGPNLVISPDIPYVRIYEIDYVNLIRNSVSETSVATEISTTGGSVDETGSSSGQAGNKSKSTVINTSKNDFWKMLADNITLLLHEKSDAGKAVDRVVVNSLGGVVSVLATEREHVNVQQFVDKLMSNVRRQVLIEATIVEVELSDRYQAGVDWQRLSNNNGLDNNGPSFRSLMTDGNYDTPPIFSLTYSNAARNIFAAVKALETFGDTKVLSSPKIMAINNQMALLKVVDETVYFTVEREIVEATDSSAARETFTSEIHTIPVGLVMSVIPQITGQDNVTMNIRPTISRITGFKVDPAPRLAGANFDNLIPEIQIREMESFLRVNNGQTVVLGGLMQNKKSNDQSSVPFFSDLPFVGRLFDSRDDDYTKTELVIFLKPTVIRNGSLDGDFKDFRQYLPELEPVSGGADMAQQKLSVEE